MVNDSFVPPELERAFLSGELIICVGPGLGRDAGLPDACALVEELIADAQTRDLELDLPALRERARSGRALEALEILERRLGPRFGRVIERCLIDHGGALPPLARAIFSLAAQLRAVYTTGLDRLLERAFADAWPSFSSARPDLVRRRRLIFKLCGTLEFSESWVLTQAAFEREFGERSLRRQLLVSAYRAHCLLFVGFDPRAELDARILELLSIGDDERQLPSHFIVLPHCPPAQRTLLERRGLHVIDGAAPDLLRTLSGGPVTGKDPQAALPACPYPGLSAFGAGLSTVFHGRRAEISQAAARLGGLAEHHRRWLAIEGASGVGKSSFVHAGLIPALHQGFAENTPSRWKVVCLRPGARPFRVLAGQLAQALRPPDVDTREHALEQLGQRILAAQDPAANLADFVAELSPVDAGVLVVVDQLEELITSSESRERERFVACLSLLLERELIYLITTMRADFGALMLERAPSMGRLLNNEAERHTLAPISRVGLRAAIVEPAAQLGVRFEPELVERIIADAEQHHGVRAHPGELLRTSEATLPLVAHILRGLWDTRDDQDLLALEGYLSLGGVSGALSRSAELLLEGLDARQLDHVHELLLHLVNLDGERLARRSLRRKLAIEVLGEGPEAEDLLARLTGKHGPRLLVTRKEEDHVAVDLVHETLLYEWDRLRDWIAADRAQLARDEVLARRARAWVSSGSSWRSLPRGPERRALLRGRPRGEKAEVQRDYQWATRCAGWLRGGAWVGLLTVLSGAGVWVARSNVEQEGRLSESKQEASESKQEASESKQEASESKQEASVAKAEKEREVLRKQVGDLLAEPMQCRAALDLLLQEPALLEDSELRSAFERAVFECELVIGPAEQLRAGSGAPVLLAHPRDLQELWTVDVHGLVEHRSLADSNEGSFQSRAVPASAIEIAPDGARVALVQDGNTHLWTRTGELIETPGGKYPRFSPTGRYLVIRSKDSKRVRVYDAHTGEQGWESEENTARAVAISDRYVALAHARRPLLTVRELKGGGEPRELKLSHALLGLAFAGSGQELIAVNQNAFQRIKLSDIEATVQSTLGYELSHGNAFIEVSPDDGSAVLVNDRDGHVALTDRLLAPRWHSAHAGVGDESGGESGDEADLARRMGPRFALDGSWAVIPTTKRELQLRTVHGRGGVGGKIELDDHTLHAFAPSRRGIVIADERGRVELREIDAAPHWRIALPSSHNITALSFERTLPHKVYAANSDGIVYAWETGPGPLELVRKLDTTVLALGVSDGELSAVTKDGVLHRWRGEGEEEPSLLGCDQVGRAALWANEVALACKDGPLLWGVPGTSLKANTSTQEDVRALGLGASLAHADALHVELWKVNAAPLQIPAAKVTSLAFNEDETLLLSGNNNGEVQLWQLGAGEAQPLDKVGFGAEFNVESVALDHAGQWFAAGDDKHGQVRIWRRNDGDFETFELTACPDHSVTVLAFTPDSSHLVAGCSDGSLHAWPLSLPEQIRLACHRLDAVNAELPPLCPARPLESP